MAGQEITGSGDRQWDRARRDFSLTRAMAGAAGLPVDDGREREVQQELRQRSGRQFAGIPCPVEIFDEPVEQRATQTTTTASNIVATDYMNQMFIDRLREQVAVRRLGARVLRGLTGDVSIPRLDSSASTGWVAEDSALSTSSHTFSNVTMQPRHAGGITELSRQLLQQASPDIEQLVRRDFAQILASALDRVAIEGGGANEPTGILANNSVSSIDMSTGPNWDQVQQLIGLIEDENAEATGFLTRPSVVRTLRSTEKVSGSPEHGWIMDARNNLDGFGVTRTNLVPTDGSSPETSYLILGNWSDLLIGFWSELDVLVNPYAAGVYERGAVSVRAMMTADVALRHPESFAYGHSIA
jgi:HK97 family phage major capsid protein